jgi:hypothetical protein
LVEVKPGASTHDLIFSFLSCIKYWSFHDKKKYNIPMGFDGMDYQPCLVEKLVL